MDREYLGEVLEHRADDRIGLVIVLWVPWTLIPSKLATRPTIRRRTVFVWTLCAAETRLTRKGPATARGPPSSRCELGDFGSCFPVRARPERSIRTPTARPMPSPPRGHIDVSSRAGGEASPIRSTPARGAIRRRYRSPDRRHGDQHRTPPHNNAVPKAATAH